MVVPGNSSEPPGLEHGAQQDPQRFDFKRPSPSERSDLNGLPSSAGVFTVNNKNTCQLVLRMREIEVEETLSESEVSVDRRQTYERITEKADSKDMPLRDCRERLLSKVADSITEPSETTWGSNITGVQDNLSVRTQAVTILQVCIRRNLHLSVNQARPTHLRSGQRPHSSNYISQTGRCPVGLDGTVASQKIRNAPLGSQAKPDERGDKGLAQDGGGSVYFTSSAQADKSTNKETSTAPC